ncbi:unnamed protein product [Adineta steineri]|uniref:Uncharacterized protein n=1 Tax=Adineta steineri TaxID=433720 RepID=A0A816DDA8_9BILA|nr:unnamed protein product [Adineta steineri]
MNQLSTNIIINSNKDIEINIEKIPNYLTKQNKSFKQILHQALSKITTTSSDDTDKREELRKIAILIYRIMLIQSYQLLWAAYLKSGMGQLIISSKIKLSCSTTLSLWPKDIKTMVQSKNMDKTNDTYLKYVNDRLNELEQQLRQNQTELNIKANRFQGYTSSVQKMIETYIEQNLYSIRMEIEHKVQLIHYDYHIHALKLEYFHHNPNKYQEQLMKQICQSKYAQETTEQEYYFLQKLIAYYNSPNQSFDSSPIAHSTLLDSIEDQDIRQELFKQYKSIALQSRESLFATYMKSAEDQRQQYKKKHEEDIKTMYPSKHSLNDTEKLSTMMIHIIDERCQKISERIKCIYKFKVQSILSKS